jgi:hypothetical protein
MNLFRSEEHARDWSSFNPDYVKTLKPLSFWADLFSNPIFRFRGRLDYISWLRTDEAKQARKELATKMP